MKDGRTVKLKLNDAKSKGYPVPDAPPPPPAPAPAAKPAAGAPAPAPPPPPTEVKVVQGYNLADIKPEDHPLYVYGGLIITPEQAMQIEPGRIGEVHVIKSDDAIKRYGEKAKNGAVLIEPKNTSYEEFSRVGRNPETGVVTVQGKPLKGQPKEVVVTGYAKPNTGNTNVVERPINISDIAGKQPLLMLEGKEINKAELDKLDPGNIESINVLKGENAIAKYGQKGENGVIEIVMKAKPKQEAKKQ
jgi:hypothetical protein